MNSLVLAIGVALSTALASNDESSGDWPNFLGPNRTGKVELSGVEFDWSEGGPEVLWRMDIGKGFGGVSVRDGEVFLLDREVGEMDVLLCLELETGDELWSDFYEAPGRLQYPGSRSVPTVTEDFVYTVGGHGHVIGFDRKKRVRAWSANLEEDYGGNLPGYGWACSALVVGDLVVVSALGQEVGLVAFDRHTGEEAWVTKPVGISHSTPVLLNLLGQEQIVFVSAMPGNQSGLDQAGELTISSFDPADGSLLWETVTPGSSYPIPGPIQIDNERFFVTGGYRGGSAMMRISKDDGGYSFERVFYTTRGSQIHNPILHDDHIYMIVNENWTEQRNRRREGGLMCLSLAGEERWRTKDDPYFGRGNWVIAGDHIFVQDGFDGTLSVVRASPESFELVAETDLFGIDDRRDHQMWAAMALAGRHLLLRSQDELVCVEL